jgi:hypothetical protein
MMMMMMVMMIDTEQQERKNNAEIQLYHCVLAAMQGGKTGRLSMVVDRNRRGA